MDNFFSFPAMAAAMLVAAGASSADAASAYWSFQVNNDGASGGGDLLVKENFGFATTPTLSVTRGTGQGSTTSFLGGGRSYTSPYTSTVYAGTTAGSAVPGYSMSWSTPSNPAVVNNTIAGAAFTISLNTVGLSDVKLGFDIRSASGNNAAVPPPLSFSAMEYSLNDGADWVSTGLTSPTWAASTWEAEEINFSSLSVLNNKSSVMLRFTFADAGVSNTIATNMNIRVDNLLLTAVPEPGSLALAAGCATMFLLRRSSRRH